MADQVFDLTQTGQQVQDIINDASKVKDAGAQTTLTTESILLKDINGNYHKILKSSFTEAIRDTLAGLLVNNDKGTTISRIAAIASGDFGSITPTNLASVLGVRVKIVYKGTGTANSIKNIQLTPAKAPTRVPAGAYMCVAYRDDLTLAPWVYFILSDGTNITKYKKIDTTTCPDLYTVDGAFWFTNAVAPQPEGTEVTAYWISISY